MFKKIVEYFKTGKARKRIKKVIKLSYGIIFSEKYDLSLDEEVERFKHEIENICKNRIEVLQAYAILNPILYDRIPIEKIDLIYFVGLTKDIQNKKRNNEILSLEIQLEETKLKINLLLMDIYVKAGKGECDKNEYSFRGLVYRMEKAKKAPATSEETEKFKKYSDNLDALDEQIKIKEQQNKSQ